MYRVIDSQNRIKLESTLSICQAWIKHYRAEFFCRVVPVVEVKATAGTFIVFAY